MLGGAKKADELLLPIYLHAIVHWPTLAAVRILPDLLIQVHVASQQLVERIEPCAAQVMHTEEADDIVGWQATKKLGAEARHWYRVIQWSDHWH